MMQESPGLIPDDLLYRLIDLIDSVIPLIPEPATEIDWSICPVAIWKKTGQTGYLEPILEISSMTLEDLKGIDRQKSQLVANTAQFVEGLPANNVLLTGSRGTGKSSLIQALLNAFFQSGLRVVQVDKSDLVDLLEIVDAIRSEPYRFIIFCDDLSFEANDESYKALKSALDGSLYSAPENLLIYATSNRRHLLPEYHKENEDATIMGGEIHYGEAIEEKISLSDRFGLWVTFYPVSQSLFLEIAQHWVAQLARRYGIEVGWTEETERAAIRWGQTRGNRSGRAANQFARHWVGQALLAKRLQEEPSDEP